MFERQDDDALKRDAAERKAARRKFAEEWRERVAEVQQSALDCLRSAEYTEQLRKHVCDNVAWQMWKLAGRIAKERGLYSASTFYADAGRGLRSMVEW